MRLWRQKQSWKQTFLKNHAIIWWSRATPEWCNSTLDVLLWPCVLHNQCQSKIFEDNKSNTTKLKVSNPTKNCQYTLNDHQTKLWVKNSALCLSLIQSAILAGSLTLLEKCLGTQAFISYSNKGPTNFPTVNQLFSTSWIFTNFIEVDSILCLHIIQINIIDNNIW